MSAGVRKAAQYRSVPSAQLRNALNEYVRNARARAAINIVLDERQNAHQEAFDAAQVVLDAIGGQDAPELHARALGASMRHAELQEWLEAERAMGVADALWDYIRERSDT